MPAKILTKTEDAQRKIEGWRREIEVIERRIAYYQESVKADDDNSDKTI